MKERRSQEASYVGYLIGIVTEVALTVVMFGVAFLIIFLLERLVK